jgi:hypothetical protein
MAALHSQGNCNDAAEVDTHFRIPVRSGQSTFTVQIPQHHLLDTRRRFFFSELHVIPDFFSLEAEKLRLDADIQEDQVLEKDVKVRIVYDDPKKFYGAPFDRGTATSYPDDLVAKINQHFESRKPDYCHTTPLFIDWIDKAMHDTMEIPKYVQELAEIYYGEEYDEVKHKNKLPLSVRELEGTNNYLAPIGGTMDYENQYDTRILLRLWLAPYTRVVLSNIYIFTNDLGFNAAEMGQLIHKQHHLINDTDHWVVKLTAREAPRPQISKIKFILHAWVSSNPVVSRIKRISIAERDWNSDAKLIQTLAAAFKQTSHSTNVAFSVAFNDTTKTYEFKFPETEAVTVQVICETDFAYRLGFGFSGIILRGMTAKPQKDRQSNDDAQKRASAVVYDTGPIICQLDNLCSNTTSGTNYQTMAALYPHASGTLSMPRWGGSYPGSGAVRIAVNMHAGAANYPVTFRLLRIYDNQAIKDFIWNCDAYVYGVLKGACFQVPVWRQ